MGELIPTILKNLARSLFQATVIVVSFTSTRTGELQLQATVIVLSLTHTMRDCGNVILRFAYIKN